MQRETVMPEKMLEKCEKGGTVERFEYDTFTYEEENKALHKGAWVYLPYG
jgi:endo-1,4-beta-xylanase